MEELFTPHGERSSYFETDVEENVLFIYFFKWYYFLVLYIILFNT